MDSAKSPMILPQHNDKAECAKKINNCFSEKIKKLNDISDSNLSDEDKADKDEVAKVISSSKSTTCHQNPNPNT